MKGPLIAGAAGALAVLAIHSLLAGVKTALFPWVEANQGLISIIALGTALFFAVVEYRRANSAAAERRTEYVDTVLAMVGELEAEGRTLNAAIDASEAAGDMPDGARHDWDRKRVRVGHTIALLRPSAPPDGPLALALAELHEALQNVIGGRDVAEVRASLVRREQEIGDAKAKVAARR